MSDRTFDLLLKQDVTGKTAQIHLSQELYDVTQIRIKLTRPSSSSLYEPGPLTHRVTLNRLAEGTAVDWGVDNARSVADAKGTLSYDYDVSADDLPTPVISIYGRILSGGAPFPYETTEIIKLGNIDDAGGLFDSLGQLTKIDDVEGFQRICDKSTSLKECFYNCSRLTEIPTGLFDHCTAVTDFSDCFNHCRSLMAIPAGLFDHCTEVTDFSDCFSDCGSLTAIPAGLFANCTAVTDFSNCFFYCSSLTEIPAGLFDHCTAVTDFSGCFTSGISLTAIPTGLFDHCTAVTDFSDCFNSCSSLTAIPAGLFANCTAVTDFSRCFYLLRSLTGETPHTMVDGKKIKLWERSLENGFAKVTNYQKCFYSCDKLSDYAEIPDDWK